MGFPRVPLALKAPFFAVPTELWQDAEVQGCAGCSCGQVPLLHCVSSPSFLWPWVFQGSRTELLGCSCGTELLGVQTAEVGSAPCPGLAEGSWRVLV